MCVFEQPTVVVAENGKLAREPMVMVSENKMPYAESWLKNFLELHHKYPLVVVYQVLEPICHIRRATAS